MVVHVLVLMLALAVVLVLGLGMAAAIALALVLVLLALALALLLLLVWLAFARKFVCVIVFYVDSCVGAQALPDHVQWCARMSARPHRNVHANNARHKTIHESRSTSPRVASKIKQDHLLLPL